MNESIKTELGRLIESELKDPRFKDTLIGVTSVHTTPDMKYAKVFVSIYADEAKQKEMMTLLESAKGFLRKKLSEILTTRFTPELKFELDTSLDYAMHIEKLLREINGKQ